MEQHRRLDRELEHLRDRLLLLGGETETALQRSIYALVKRDSDTANAVLKDDDAIDNLELEIDRLCVDIIALRQPAARDLIARDDEIDEIYNHIFHDLIDMMVADSTTTRRAARLLFVAKHIERIADYVTDICELTVYMTQAEFIKHSN